MLSYIRNLLDRKAPPNKGGAMMPEVPEFPEIRSAFNRGKTSDGPVQAYTKVFRYRLPAGQTEEPALVEVVGSFTQWQKIPLLRDSKLDAWHTMIHHIPANKTHHYMLLVDGVPTYDKGSDGYAIPHGAHEEQYQILTEQGPRVLMLFAQAK
jgi:hypothetical protein